MPTRQDGVENRDKVYANSKTLYCGSNIRFRQGSSGYYFKIMPSMGRECGVRITNGMSLGLGKKPLQIWGQKKARHACSPRLSLAMYRQVQNKKITYKVMKTEHI